MALTNIFSINKKKPLVSSVNQGYAATNPLSSFGQKVVSGQGMNTIQNMIAPKTTVQKQTQTVKPQMSVAPKQIQGSGMGSNYASNPTNYVAPAYTPPVYKPVTPKTDPTQSFVDSASQTANRQKTFAEQQRDQQQKFIKEKYSLANQQLKEALPAAQQQFGQFKANTEASIADLLAGGERQKSQASDYYGDAQRLAAQTLRETQGQTQRTFAGLGTLDSRGEGSFAQANENQMSEFNRNTQQILKAKADKLSEIDATVSAAERSARATITQEEAKLNELARNIEYAVANNSLEEAQQLTQAYNETQQYIYDIEDALTQTKYQFGLEQQKLQDELAKTQSFTPEFMAGGQPTNQAEFEFFIKNKMGGGAGNKSASALQVEGKAGAGLRALQTIEAEILNNPNILIQASIPGSPGARQFEAAMSSITDAIGGLRTGASVSPEQQRYYRNILPKAGDSPETIQYKLDAVKQELQGYSQGSNNMNTDVPPELMSILGL